jgi:hypothetical protein
MPNLCKRLFFKKTSGNWLKTRKPLNCCVRNKRRKSGTTILKSLLNTSRIEMTRSFQMESLIRWAVCLRQVLTGGLQLTKWWKKTKLCNLLSRLSSLSKSMWIPGSSRDGDRQLIITRSTPRALEATWETTRLKTSGESLQLTSRKCTFTATVKLNLREWCLFSIKLLTFKKVRSTLRNNYRRPNLKSKCYVL